jgi:hypothetical protein
MFQWPTNAWPTSRGTRRCGSRSGSAASLFARPAAGGWLIDLRNAFRSLRAERPTTVLALLILTLGIAAGTTTFYVVDVVLRQLPYHEPDQLVAIARLSKLDSSASPLAPQDNFALRSGVAPFEDMAAARYSQVRFGGQDSKPPNLIWWP